MNSMRITLLLIFFSQISFGQKLNFPIEKPFEMSFYGTGTYRYSKGNQGFTIDSVLKGDTLKLMAHNRNCGEWGGHNEFILISRVRDSLFVEFIFDGNFSDCYSLRLPSRLDNKQEPKKICTEKLKELINEYIFLFKQYFDENDDYSNAPDCFGITFRNSENYFVDNSSVWADYYNKFKNEVFKNNLKIEEYNLWYFYGMSESQINKTIEYIEKEMKRIERFGSPENFSSGETFYEEEIRSIAK